MISIDSALLGQFELFRGLSEIPWLTKWLTPLWILSVGVLLGLLALLVIWAVLFIVHPRGAKSVKLALSEGVLYPISWIFGVIACFAILGMFVATQPMEILQSALRLPATGERVYSFTVAPSPAIDDSFDFQEVEKSFPVNIDRDELQYFQFQSDQELIVSGVPEATISSGARIEIPGGGEGIRWTKETDKANPFPEENETIGAVYVKNQGEQDATLTVTAYTLPRHPEVSSIPIAAGFVAILFLFYMLHRALLPRVSAVALSTTKSEIVQPLFVILLILGGVILVLSYLIPYYTFGEDVKMYKDVGFATIMIASILQAVWASSTSISEEIEGRTALTVLSKPIARWEFILGKHLGILWSVGLLFLILSIIFLTTLSYKPIYDAKESSTAELLWQTCHYEVVQTIPGLVLTFMQAAILAAVSVAISTRLPMLANFVICAAVYVLGNLSPLIVQSTVANKQFEPVVFVARLIATVFPNLENFNMQPAVAAGMLVSWQYLAVAAAYCLIYTLVAMLFALFLFEDRDVG